MTNIIEVLRERGLLEDMTSPELSERVESPCVVYAGFDPTAESLQVGNLVTIMMLAHFQRCGHRVIALVGGATGSIGDPSGKSAERPLLSHEQIETNAAGIRENLARFLDFDHPEIPAKIVNNLDWMKDYSFIDFLRDVGKHFRMGTMLGKESVRSRLDSDEGMSFCEFSYQLLQGYDFLHLFDKESCNIQIGGSDQWGNIIAGTDLIHKLRGEQGFGITSPLITDRNGQKLGKSEGRAVFLSAAKTSCYEFYQYFMNIDDADVIGLLKVFTFLSLEEIGSIETEMAAEPHKRLAQKTLAEHLTRHVHGDEGLESALKASQVLFGGSLEGCDAAELMQIFSDVPSAELEKASVLDQPVLDVAVAAGVCKSKGEGRRLIDNGGLYLNNVRVEDLARSVGSEDLVDASVLILRSGKKKYTLVKVDA